jgi:hypothetical protein
VYAFVVFSFQSVSPPSSTHSIYVPPWPSSRGRMWRWCPHDRPSAFWCRHGPGWPVLSGIALSVTRWYTVSTRRAIWCYKRPKSSTCTSLRAPWSWAKQSRCCTPSVNKKLFWLDIILENIPIIYVYLVHVAHQTVVKGGNVVVPISKTEF